MNTVSENGHQKVITDRPNSVTKILYMYMEGPLVSFDFKLNLPIELSAYFRLDSDTKE